MKKRSDFQCREALLFKTFAICLKFVDFAFFPQSRSENPPCVQVRPRPVLFGFQDTFCFTLHLLCYSHSCSPFWNFLNALERSGPVSVYPQASYCPVQQIHTLTVTVWLLCAFLFILFLFWSILSSSLFLKQPISIYWGCEMYSVGLGSPLFFTSCKRVEISSAAQVWR